MNAKRPEYGRQEAEKHVKVANDQAPGTAARNEIKQGQRPKKGTTAILRNMKAGGVLL